MKPKALFKNVTGATPILAGVVLDGILTKMVSGRIPYTGRGIGQIAVGLAGAGLLRMLGSYSRIRGLGEGLFTGGLVGTVGCAFQNFMRDGLRSLSLSDDLDGFGESFINPNAYTENSFQGMGEFVSPRQVSGAFQSESTASQYSLPNANAAYVPSAGMQPPQSPVQAAQARRMSDYEGAAIGAMVDSAGGNNIDGLL